MNIIGITGPAGSGKDTAADALKALSYQRFHFSGPLKRGLSAMFGWPLEDLQGADRAWREVGVKLNEHLLPSPRHMMQTLGTEWGREQIHPDLWVMLAENDVVASGAQRAVFADLRFENEAAWIRAAGGIVVHIRRADSGIPGLHASEAGVNIDQQDYIIYNDAMVEQLHNAILDVAKMQLKIGIY